MKYRNEAIDDTIDVVFCYRCRYAEMDVAPIGPTDKLCGYCSRFGTNITEMDYCSRGVDDGSVNCFECLHSVELPHSAFPHLLWCTKKEECVSDGDSCKDSDNGEINGTDN